MIGTTALAKDSPHTVRHHITDHADVTPDMSSPIFIRGLLPSFMISFVSQLDPCRQPVLLPWDIDWSTICSPSSSTPIEDTPSDTAGENEQSQNKKDQPSVLLVFGRESSGLTAEELVRLLILRCFCVLILSTPSFHLPRLISSLLLFPSPFDCSMSSLIITIEAV